MCSNELVVNRFSHRATVYQCSHCQWMIAVNHVDLDKDIGRPLKYLVSKASRIHFSLSDHVTAGLGVLDFDTTSSV